MGESKVLEVHIKFIVHWYSDPAVDSHLRLCGSMLRSPASQIKPCVISGPCCNIFSHDFWQGAWTTNAKMSQSVIWLQWCWHPHWSGSQNLAGSFNNKCTFGFSFSTSKFYISWKTFAHALVSMNSSIKNLKKIARLITTGDSWRGVCVIFNSLKHMKENDLHLFSCVLLDMNRFHTQ